MTEKRFTFDDYMLQLAKMRTLGWQRIVSSIQGIAEMSGRFDAGDFEAQLNRLEAIYKSMTIVERQDLAVFDDSRQRRIARGAGVESHEVMRFLHEFDVCRRVIATTRSWRGGRDGHR